MQETYSGSCGCGKVKLVARGLPKRVGLCHCLTCQKVQGSAFYWFAVYDADHLEIAGAFVAWPSSAGYSRAFCADCGSHVFATAMDEMEISPASFSSGDFPAPQYEAWTIRRRAWLTPLPVPQFERDRLAGSDSAPQKQ